MSTPTIKSHPHRAAAIAMATLTLALLAACTGGGQDDTPTQEATEAVSEGPSATPTVRRGIDSVVTADGALEAQVPPQSLSFGTTGEVLEITVAPGDPVALGDLLARVDDEAITRTISDAEAAVVSAREGVATAELALSRAELGTELETARLEVERAKNNLWAQQVQRDGICGRAGTAFTPQSECDAAQASVQASEQGVAIAEASYQAAQQAREDELQAARARAAAARSSLEQARERLSDARDARVDATITAPFAGVVETVHMAPGVEAAPGAPAITLAKTHPLDFATTNLGERYVGDVAEGAAAEVWLTAWPDRPLPGQVRRIAASGAPGEGGAIVYRVWIALEETDLPIRAGMTGVTEIAVEGE